MGRNGTGMLTLLRLISSEFQDDRDGSSASWACAWRWSPKRSRRGSPGLDADARRPAAEKPRRLTFKESRKLEALPDSIAGLEAEQEQIHQALADPTCYRTAWEAVAQLTARLARLEQESVRG